ncbi:hypothetical protein G9464_20345 [Halostella sp. JP-L12]|uniref:DUF7546 family protein n=1 Tax=Halostella TaxID=1843185 RepID=UPI000EF82BB0|nr:MULTISPECIES: hypothetical protein [Halostella]NHN49923.1 hypothetical protein [Halostella sp. JP-L12]
MSTRTLRPALPDGRTLLYGALVLNTEFLAILFYPEIQRLTLDGWLNVAYALIWINVGAWAILRTDPPPASPRQRRIALGVAAGYFVLLAAVGGLVSVGDLFSPVDLPATGPRIAWLIPGWGPAVTYVGDLVTVALLPYRVVGYLALAYLVYATVLDAAGAAVSGVLGLLSCVSCTWPVLASLATGLLGGSSALALAVTTWSHELSTVVFVATVALLHWRPFGR